MHEAKLIAVYAEMAGPIRQQIDVSALEKYIDKSIPEIKTPLDVKQVSTPNCDCYPLSFAN